MPVRLALHGGAPVRSSFLPYSRQNIDDKDIQAVVEVLRSDYLTTGPVIQRFENRVAQYVGSQYAAAIANGTAALHAACFAARVGPGDEVITTPMTFAASANCALYMGARPVFADIDPDTYNIDPHQVERLISERTRAVVAVDFTGQPADLEPLIDLTREQGLTLIEDAAHSLGSQYKGRPVGAIADLTTFSFHPVKHITTGEGGMITTNNRELYKRLVMFRTHGITRDSDKLLTPDQGDWYNEQLVLGYNYRITDIQCALGCSQMDRLPEFIAQRRAIVNRYNSLLADFKGVTRPFQAAGTESTWHLYIIKLELERFKAGRKEIFAALRAENIGVNVHYIPVYYHPYYQSLGYKRGLCPKAEDLYERIITLPLFPGMQDSDVEDVVKALDKVLHYYYK